MNTDLHELKHRELTKRIIGVFFQVYNELGFGFLDSVYHKSLALALVAEGLKVCSPVEIPVWFRGHQVGEFEGDIMVDKCVLLGLLASSAAAQLSSSNGHRDRTTAELWG